MRDLFAALLTALLSIFLFASVLERPAYAGLASHSKKRDTIPLNEHIKKLFGETIGQTKVGAPEKVGDDNVWPVFNGSRLLGYAFRTFDLAPLPGYSGRPIESLIAIDPQGGYLGVKILHHEEPIFLKGMNQESLDNVAEQYKGLKVQDNIKVRAPTDSSPRVVGNSYVNGISRATISVEVMNQSVVKSAVLVASQVVEGFTRLEAAKVNPDITETVTWDSLLKSKWVAKTSFTYGEVYDAFEGTGKDYSQSERKAAPDEELIELSATQVNVPSIGKYLLGEAGYKRLLTDELKPGENAILLMSNGPYSFLGEDFVARTVPRRVNIQQGERIIEVRDVYFYNFLQPNWPKDMPQYSEMRIFRIDASDAFDPSLPWKLNLNVIRGVSRLAEKVTKTFPVDYKLPERLFIKKDSNAGVTPLWLQLWQNRWIEIIALIAGLALLTAIAVKPKLVVRNAQQFKNFRWMFLFYTIGFIGYFSQAQLSVTHVLTLFGSLLNPAAASGLLLDPIICILGIYVLVTLVVWGRGFFCGWLCPFGAMQEVMSWLGEKLRLPQKKISWRVHSFGNKIKYAIFLGLLGASIFSLTTAELMAEVEPFKTAITLNFVRTWPFVIYAIALLLASMFVHKFFCRYVCPLGAGLAILGKLRLIDSIPRRNECGTPCQRCSVQCGIKAIKPAGEIDYDECIQCYECVVIHDDKTQCVPLIQAEKRINRQVENGGQPSVIRPLSKSAKLEPA